MTTSFRTGRRVASAGAAALALLVAAGCGHDSSGDAGADPAAVLPANSTIYIEATVKPEGDLRDDVVALAKRITKLDDPFGDLVKSLDEDTEVKYDEDIEPWLGERVGIAITSLNAQDVDPDFAAAIPTSDPDKALETVKKDVEGKEGTYEGVDFIDDGDGMLAGLVGDTLVLGTPKGFRSAVDASKADEQLDDSKELADVREAVQGDRNLGYAFIDVQDAIGDFVADDPLLRSQGDTLRKLVADVPLAGAAFSIEEDAIRVEAVTVGGRTPAPAGDPSAALAALPADTILGAGLGDIGTALSAGVDQVLGVGPLAGQDPKQLLEFAEGQFGLKLKEDLLSWMGEGAFFVQGRAITSLGGGLVVTSKDPATTKRTLDKLVPIIREAGAQVVADPPEGATDGFRVALGAAPVANLQLLVGLRDDRFVVGVNPTVVSAILQGETEGRLGDTPAFKTAAGKLGDGVKPSFFLDVSRVVGFLGLAAGGDPDFQQAKPILESFTTLVAGGGRSGSSNRSELVLGVK